MTAAATSTPDRLGGHMHRAGARHVGEPVVRCGQRGDRRACLYGAVMVAKHMPGFAAMATAFEAVLRPPATILLVRADDPDGPALTYDIPALLLPASVAERARQTTFDEVAD